MTDKLITAAEVRARYGNISDMTLWRWLDDAALGFPRGVYIQRRRSFRETEIVAFIERQAA